MNVWAIDKDLSIKLFLLELIHRFGENTFLLNEEVVHPQAVEIFMAEEPGLRAYIFSFCQQAEHYGIDLFFPLEQSEIVGESEELNLDEVISIVQTHFDLS
jgi:hypothetical protein